MIFANRLLRRAAGFTLALFFFLSSAALAASPSIIGVRFGKGTDHDRIVLDVSEIPKYAARTEKVCEEYRHPLWKVAGALAQKMGGHGGMDFLMDLRLCYCLQNGLPLDMDVYDLAASCSLCELSERSALNRGASQDVPDFTRGGWKTAKPLGIETVDLEKLGITDVTRDESQLNV